MEEAKIYIRPKTKDAAAQAFFKQGDIEFRVYRDLDKTLGAAGYGHTQSCLDRLTDSQIVTMASYNGIPVAPYVRELVRSPLQRVIQYVHYRDLQKASQELLDRISERDPRVLAEYKRRLAEYVPEAEGGTGKKKRKSEKAQVWTHSFRATKGSYRDEVQAGRELQLFDLVKELKEATFAQIVEKTSGKIKTKQDMTKIIMRFLKSLIAKGAIEEVK